MNALAELVGRVGLIALDKFQQGRERRRAKRADRKAARKKPAEDLNVKETVMLKGYKTYIGIGILVLTPIAAKYGVDAAELQGWVTAIGTVVGGIVAAYGRAKAGT